MSTEEVSADGDNASMRDKAGRRQTPLALRLKERIRHEGPITISAYMQACLQDADYGYYRTRPAIGAKGDFITAPEISQVFGELIGLWCAVTWQMLGEPAHLHLIELGPGRGTLMADLLRATRLVPGFGAALSVHLVESNEVLVDAQRERLTGIVGRLCWHASLDEAARSLDGDAAPVLLIANEFLDTMPVTQMQMTSAGIALRGVGLDGDGNLSFISLPAKASEPRLEGAAVGEVFERQDFAFMATLGEMAKARALAALFIDYGHVTAARGETLQAVREHAAEHPLCSPGEADITVHVDFSAVLDAGKQAGLETDGALTQAEYLGRLGIMERASRLMAANPSKAQMIEASIARLMAPSGMGSRFKVIGMRAGICDPLPGFEGVSSE
ncbi:MAG: SAM-dependent methyltransferase [Hyphomicrobium sp.]|jgi:SAM-dependent MidA family methyltransferase